MGKSERKKLESKIKLSILEVLRKTDVSAAIKTEKLIKSLAKEIAKKFSKSVGNVKKKLTVAKPLTFKRAPVKKKLRSVAAKKKKK